MDFTTYLLLSFIFGTIGIGYSVYGKRQEKFIPIIAGVTLCFYPYFVSNLFTMIGVGIFLLAMPFIFKF